MNMKLSLSALLIIVLIVFFSIFIANISNLIAIHVENTITGGDREDAVSRNKKEFSRGTKNIISDDPKNLMWFVQVSVVFLLDIAYCSKSDKR